MFEFRKLANIRPIGKEKFIEKAKHRIPYVEPYYVLLDETPLFEPRIIIEPTAYFSEVFAVDPTAPGQFRVDYRGGRVLFYEGDKGKPFTATYYGKGSWIWAEDVTQLQDLSLLLHKETVKIKTPQFPLNIGDVDLSGNFTLFGNLSVTGTVSETLRLDKDLYVNGNLYVIGAEYIQTIERIEIAQEIVGNLDVSGNTVLGTSIGDTLKVYAKSNFYNPVTFHSDVTFLGPVNLGPFPILNLVFPNWTTATRPVAPVPGMVGFNLDTGQFEGFSNISGWVILG